MQRLKSKELTNNMSDIAQTPEPPYFAVIFTSIRREGDNRYAETVQRLLEIARRQSGFLGYETARSGLGISVSYWASLDAIQSWRQHPEHCKVQAMASEWYSQSCIRVCRVERSY